MQHLYAPWRDEYIKNKIEGCPFCYISKNPQEDEENKVLYRDEFCFVVMNLYPYTPGHFMVIPNTHIDNIENLESDVWLHMSNIVQKCVKMLKSEFKTHAVNIGMNLGKEAGAGVAEHIHYHIVPRWQRDTNFITTIANTRVYSTNFDEIYNKMQKTLSKYI